MTRRRDASVRASAKALWTCLALCALVLPASAEDQPPEPGSVMEVSTLMANAPAASAEPAGVPDWAGDWQEQVVLPRHDVSPYVPIDMLSPYPPPRGDLAPQAAGETAVEADTGTVVSLSPRAEKTSLEASQAVAPVSRWHMLDTGEAFKIVDSRGRLMAYILYHRGAVPGSGSFLGLEEARAFAQSVLDLQSAETVTHVSSRAADASQTQ